eukprot:TRINITY_DN20646_c0_g1_i1.p2 TRINITY_DN20646_c0_g1~~TRINITY_DN20646_c0_g1_i1.p2  ORF type:complete len:145 (+),score=35.69 TRINITY_DN20646_c0_g1_i1:43-435(+)
MNKILAILLTCNLAMGSEVPPPIDGYTLQEGKGPVYPETLLQMTMATAAHECDIVTECQYVMVKDRISDEGIYHIMFAMRGSPVDDMNGWFVFEKDHMSDETDEYVEGEENGIEVDDDGDEDLYTRDEYM